MKVSVDKRVEKVLRTFSAIDRSRIDKVVELFQEQGFTLGEKYLKKLTKSIWELRPGRIRVLFGMVESEMIIVNVFMKKSMKTPNQEIILAERRIRDYI